VVTFKMAWHELSQTSSVPDHWKSRNSEGMRPQLSHLKPLSTVTKWNILSHLTF